MLEDRVATHMPRWTRGRAARLVRPLLRGMRRWTRLDAVEALVDATRGVQGLALVRLALERLGGEYRIGGAGLGAIPAEGPVVVVANHPSGAIEALALLDAVGHVRRDVQIVANAWLAAIDGLSGLLLPVDAFGGASPATSIRRIDATLRQGGCVIVFPAGEVARLALSGIRERPWRDGFARLARRHRAPVLPVYVEARNSALFYGASAVFKPASTALLAREMFARRGRPLRLSFGPALRIDRADCPRELTRRLQRELHRRCTQCAQPSLPSAREARLPAPVAPAEDPARLREAIGALQLLGRTSDGKEIRVGHPAAGDVVMREIGRLRELTFRAVGEGTGRARDVDRFDGNYDQIVLWDDEAGRIAGGYRVARVAEVLAAHGLQGLYTSTLFEFEAAAVARLAPALELGRSFVVPEYWGSRSIDYLWQGIGAYVARTPWVQRLFGPVSISATLPESARRDVVAFYAHWHGADAGAGVRARRPFHADRTCDAADRDAAFRALRERLAALGASVPMLYKQYVELCEPGGARFLAFNVDPDFSDVVDGLVEVDLARLRPAKRARYIEPRN